MCVIWEWSTEHTLWSVYNSLFMCVTWEWSTVHTLWSVYNSLFMCVAWEWSTEHALWSVYNNQTVYVYDLRMKYRAYIMTCVQQSVCVCDLRMKYRAYIMICGQQSDCVSVWPENEVQSIHYDLCTRVWLFMCMTWEWSTEHTLWFVYDSLFMCVTWEWSTEHTLWSVYNSLTVYVCDLRKKLRAYTMIDVQQSHCLCVWLPWWPSGKASASRAAGLGSIPAFPVGLFSSLSNTSDIIIGILVATLPGSWHHWVNIGTSWLGVNILWQVEIASLICSFCLSVAACTIVRADLSRR